MLRHAPLAFRVIAANVVAIWLLFEGWVQPSILAWLLGALVLFVAAMTRSIPEVVARRAEVEAKRPGAFGSVVVFVIGAGVVFNLAFAAALLGLGAGARWLWTVAT